MCIRPCLPFGRHGAYTGTLVATKKEKNNVSTFRQIGEKLKTLSYLEE